jgi:hypothetical protein
MLREVLEVLNVLEEVAVEVEVEVEVQSVCRLVVVVVVVMERPCHKQSPCSCQARIGTHQATACACVSEVTLHLQEEATKRLCMHLILASMGCDAQVSVNSAMIVRTGPPEAAALHIVIMAALDAVTVDRVGLEAMVR